MPLGQPRRIFARQPRRAGFRAAGLVLVACLAAGLASHPLVSAVGQILRGGRTPRALAADDVAVINGQTLRVAGHVVRLDGVAAPPRGAGCNAGYAGPGGAPGAASIAGTDCAGNAALHLAALVQDQRVACQVIGSDPAVARCQAGGQEISQALVASGWAVARGDAPAMRLAEQSARARHLGLWAQR